MLVRTLSGGQSRPFNRSLSGSSWADSSRQHRWHSSKNYSCTKISEEDERDHIYMPPQTFTKINIRVGGHLFQTTETTLNVFPMTLLGHRAERERFFNKGTGEYVFNRCFLSFDSILFFYQSRGILARPAYVKRAKFIKELEFFRINQFLDCRHETEVNFIKNEKLSNKRPSSKLKQLIWSMLCFRNDPRFRRSSYMFYTAMLIFSVTVICLEPSVPPKKIWFTFELFIASLFLFEYCVRIYIENNRKKFATSPLGILDLASLITSLLYIFFVLTNQSENLLRVSRFSLTVRVLKSGRISRGVQEFMHVLWSSREQVTLFVGSALITCFIAATWIQLAEQAHSLAQKSKYVSFMDWLWYSIITATGVGYGDYIPRSTSGKICGAFLSIVGVIIFSFPASQLVYKFVKLYYLPDVLGQNSKGKRKMLITAVREEFLDDLESCST